MSGWVRTVIVASAFLSVALTAACSDGAASAVPTGPFSGATGAQLYAQACATCHGRDLRGTEQGPPFLNAIYAPGHHSDAAFLAAAMSGARAHHWTFGNMPKIEGITAEQVRAITTYVREEQRKAGVQ